MTNSAVSLIPVFEQYSNNLKYIFVPLLRLAFHASYMNV
jgi:hypothetical protein